MPETADTMRHPAGGTNRPQNDGTRTAPVLPAAVRATTVVAVSVVAVVAGAVSYMHMHEVAERAGEGWRAWLVPLAVDGLVVAASMSMVVRRRAGYSAGWLAWTSMTAGILASLAANVAAAEPTLIGRAVAAWPPVALLLAYELLMSQVHAVESAGDDRLAHEGASGFTDSLPLDWGIPPAAHRHSNGTIGTTPAGLTAARRPVLLPVLDDESSDAEAARQAARLYYRRTVADGMPCTGKDLADRFGKCERWGRYQIRAVRRKTGQVADTTPARTAAT